MGKRKNELDRLIEMGALLVEGARRTRCPLYCSTNQFVRYLPVVSSGSSSNNNLPSKVSKDTKAVSTASRNSGSKAATKRKRSMPAPTVHSKKSAKRKKPKKKLKELEQVLYCTSSDSSDSEVEIEIEILYREEQEPGERNEENQLPASPFVELSPPSPRGFEEPSLEDLDDTIARIKYYLSFEAKVLQESEAQEEHLLETFSALDIEGEIPSDDDEEPLEAFLEKVRTVYIRKR